MSQLFAALYDRLLAPVERRGLDARRQQWLSPLEGRVLELGAGTGRNLPHYGPSVTELVLVEPDAAMCRQLSPRLDTRARPTRLCSAAAESLPFENESFDELVSTLVLCSVQDLQQSLSEAHRVLVPGGRLTLIEHIAAPLGSARRFLQARLSPCWSALAGGCHLDRDPRSVLEPLGFIEERSQLCAFPLVPGYGDLLLCGTWRK